ncbi:MAG: hypothetical protein AAFX94_12325, partial [Myxococcota bacterium]
MNAAMSQSRGPGDPIPDRSDVLDRDSDKLAGKLNEVVHNGDAQPDPGEVRHEIPASGLDSDTQLRRPDRLNNRLAKRRSLKARELLGETLILGPPGS